MGSKWHINSKMFYILIGIAVWFLFLNSGIHPTIAGVLVAFCVPAHPVMHTEKFINKIRDTVSRFPASEKGTFLRNSAGFPLFSNLPEMRKINSVFSTVFFIIGRFFQKVNLFS